MAILQAALSQDLAELAERARIRFERLNPSQRLRHSYMQRRNFARAFAGPDMPHEAMLTDEQIRECLS